MKPGMKLPFENGLIITMVISFPERNKRNFQSMEYEITQGKYKSPRELKERGGGGGGGRGCLKLLTLLVNSLHD